jgi:hypothetical protein
MKELDPDLRQALGVPPGPLDAHGFYATRHLDDGRWLVVEPQMFGRARLCVVGAGEDLGAALAEHFGYLAVWDYPSKAAALEALNTWNGIGEPTGWSRHLASGRRRQQDGSLLVRETDLANSTLSTDQIAELRASVARGASHECSEWWGERSGRCVLCDRLRPFRVGDIVTVAEPCMGNPAGARAIVVEQYELAHRDGWMLLFPNGNSDGFSFDDCSLFGVRHAGHDSSLANYRFLNVTRLLADWRGGLFRDVWI